MNRLSKHKILWVLGILIGTAAYGQGNLTDKLYDTYENYKEPSLDKRRIKHQQLQPLLAHYAQNPAFTVQKVGNSIEGRSLSLVSIGSGDVDIYLWSQMHGDEPTATQAIFDIFRFLESPDFAEEKAEILKNCRLHFLPMLNPDGAERFMRRNALGIDINRDALRLQSPEGRTLKRVRDSLDADFGFNLHDQSRYYNAERTDRPATISYLATAYDYETNINEVRANAMKVIVFMNDIIQKYAPGQVGRYSDAFEPRAFGDNIQKWGTSLILIESGGMAQDREKQEIRKLNYVSILSAIYTIATGEYKRIDIADYEKIPRNDRKMLDLKIEEVTYPLLGKNYTLDLGIYRNEVDREGHHDFYYQARIVDQGDLSTFYGYETFNAKGYMAKPGKVYPKTLATLSELTATQATELLKEGYLYVKIAQFPDSDTMDFGLPIIPVHEDFEMAEELRLGVGMAPNFFLEKEGNRTHVVVNGFLLELANMRGEFKNSVMQR
ncbi:M14 family zinc carboxypeptidase [Sediminicola luteus]|uniref:Peptidase M14 n=1 Tax=Sediminicola luteus TaxID=319238 RepID=A0A2A4G666_9FLAO|nr:M14 family zinc carboxypeptidase [Sediminicola luteus]PCE63921.1 peptidase M14 [Sediminicola luteus]